MAKKKKIGRPPGAKTKKKKAKAAKAAPKKTAGVKKKKRAVAPKASVKKKKVVKLARKDQGLKGLYLLVVPNVDQDQQLFYSEDPEVNSLNKDYSRVKLFKSKEEAEGVLDNYKKALGDGDPVVNPLFAGDVQVLAASKVLDQTFQLVPKFDRPGHWTVQQGLTLNGRGTPFKVALKEALTRVKSALKDQDRKDKELSKAQAQSRKELQAANAKEWDEVKAVRRHLSADHATLLALGEKYRG